jgi:hypothetical protein
MIKASEIFEAAFARPRSPRSVEYKRGVIDVLNYRFGGAKDLSGKYLYELGTAQSDAYLAGVEEGHLLARPYLSQI